MWTSVFSGPQIKKSYQELFKLAGDKGRIRKRVIFMFQQLRRQEYPNVKLAFNALLISVMANIFLVQFSFCEHKIKVKRLQ